MSSEGVEKELKFAKVEHAALRERLLDLEAERVSAAVFEDNWIFDQADESILRAGRLLRLRVDGKGALLTFKGKARFEDQVKIRPEHETRLDNAEVMRLILEALGYSVVRRYQKMREEWRLGGVVIALDHTPIGDFAEFEGEGSTTVAVRCGMEPAEAEKRSYLELYRDWLLENPESPPEMVFP